MASRLLELRMLAFISIQKIDTRQSGRRKSIVTDDQDRSYTHVPTVRAASGRDATAKDWTNPDIESADRRPVRRPFLI